MIGTKKIKVRLTFTESILGGMPSSAEIYSEYIAGNAPDAATIEEEIAAFGVDETVSKGTTVFARDTEGKPYIFDYHIKGFFKDSCGGLRKVSKSESSKLKNYKKLIDKLVFIYPRRIPLELNGDITLCQRPLRASTAQGERIALACSEEAPEGTEIEFTIELFDAGLESAVTEWLDYGIYSGIGQWRNASHGRFTYEVLSE